MEAEYRKRAERIAGQLKSIPTVQTQIFIPAVRRIMFRTC